VSDLRISRLRRDDLEDLVDRVVPRVPEGTPTRLVKVYNGGAMPSSPDHFYLGYPVEAGGAETEGGATSFAADSTNSIVVDVLGHAPSVGDILIAYAIGGRWVPERGGSSGGGSVTCTPCSLPKSDLTISWVNAFTGAGTATMTWSAPGGINQWVSGCEGNVVYELYCTGSTMEFRVVYCLSGFCPDCPTAYCSNLRGEPLGLTLISSSCSPLSLTFQATEESCPALTENGYEDWTITS
jgi:hypothetical protein